MAYDSARGVTVLFGGDRDDGKTWEWDGASWTERNITGPSPRWEHAMVYDSARRVSVLFGGGLGPEKGDTWDLGRITEVHVAIGKPVRDPLGIESVRSVGRGLQDGGPAMDVGTTCFSVLLRR